MSIKTDSTRIIAPQTKDLTFVFSQISDYFGSIWLDSSLSFSDRGKYSYIAFNPKAELKYENEYFFDQLEILSKKYKYAIGFIGYETAARLLELSPSKNNNIPDSHFFFYDDIIRYDNSINEVTEGAELYNSLLSKSPQLSKISDHKATFKPVISKSEYLKKVNRIKDHIKEGDIYQANFTTRFDIESNTPPFEIYKKLRRLNPAPYSAYMNFGDYQILSSSPERMFKKTNQHITSSPIKGTIARGKTELETRQNLKRLLNSEKDRAELLMIIDLIRNDLGKVAQKGSVKVKNLYSTEIYSSLIHLVSDIDARLIPTIELTDIFEALLPGGSITGAPKKRAVEIIASTETVPRSVYTGNIGIINNDSADFNIAIRTMIHQNDRYMIHAGGGIVADSDPELEYYEMMLKAKNLIKSLGFEDEI